MALIEAKALSKEYTTGEVTVRALTGLDFEIEPASFVSFVGPSGSGKTTLLNLIGCLDKPSSGLLHGGRNGCRPVEPKGGRDFQGRKPSALSSRTST